MSAENRRRSHFWGGVLGMALCLLPGAHAGAVEVGRSAVTISGTIMKPACKINSTGNNINFERVDVSKISQGEYKQAINMDIKCGSGEVSILLTLTAVNGFSSDVIKTSVDGLGIKIVRVRSNLVWLPNSSVESSTSANNSIEAELVAQPGVELKLGGFSAVATISAVYH